MDLSLEQTNAVENVTKGSFIPLGILIKLAIVGAHLHLFGHDVATMSLRCCHVLFQCAATAQIGDL